MTIFEKIIARRQEELESEIQRLEIERYVNRNTGKEYKHTHTALVLAIHKLMVYIPTITKPWELVHFKFINEFEITKVVDVTEAEFINILKKSH